MMRRLDGRNIKNINQTKDKFISFSVGRLKFIDSYNFLSESLDSLAKTAGIKTKTYIPMSTVRVLMTTTSK